MSSFIRTGVYIMLVASGCLLGEEVKIDLNPAPGTVSSCRSQIEFAGQVVMYSSDDDKPPRISLNVQSVQNFDHVHIDATNALRKYNSADAQITLGGKEVKNTLSDSNRQIALRIASTEFGRPIQYISTGGSLKQSEQELLCAPCDMFALGAMLENESIEIGKKWGPTNRQVQTLLSFDNLIENHITLMVKEIDKSNIAKVYVTGDVVGEVDGAKSKVRLSGVALVDLDKKIATAFRATIAEIRAASQLAPGFEGTVKVDLSCSLKGSRDLTEATVKKVSAKISEKQTTRLLWNSDSEFELIYDPKWKIILSDPEVVIMRYAEKGNLLAQCNVLRLPKRSEDNPLQLETFKAQLEKTVLGESGARITGSRTFSTSTGMRALQVLVSGTQEEIPINWMYYHLSNDEGRCVAVVLTIEEGALRTFGKADEALLESIHFVPDARNAATPQKLR